MHLRCCKRVRAVDMARVEFCVADGVNVAERVKRAERMLEAEA